MLIFLLALTPLIAIVVLIQHRLLNAVIAMGVFSLIVSCIYFMLGAPDVAITEGAIGVAFVTFIYVIALSDQGKLKVVAEEVPRFLFREGGKIKGIDAEILLEFAHQLDLKLDIEFASRSESTIKIGTEEKEIVAGAFHPTERERDDLMITHKYAQLDLVKVTREGVEGSTLPWGTVVDIKGADLPGKIRENLTVLPTTEELYRAYKKKKIGTIVIDSIRLNKLLIKKGDRLFQEHKLEKIGTISYFFGVGKNSQQIYRKLNGFIEKLNSTNAMESIREKYLK